MRFLDDLKVAYEEGKQKGKDAGSFRKQMEKAEEKRKNKLEEKEKLAGLDKEKVPYCPKCHSTSLTTTNKKLSLGRAAVGGALIGGAGAVLGGLTSKKVELLCMNCGYKFKPGKK